MELYRNGLKLTATIGLDESRGSVNVPVRLLHNEKDEYLNYTEQIHIRYLLDNQVKEEILPTDDTGFYIPGKPLSHDGPIELAVHLINGDIELVTNELSFVVKNAPNGTTQVDPSEFTWQQLVDQYVNAKLDTFANKLDLSKFEEKVNGSIENQNQNIESFKTNVNANLSNQDKKITDLQTSTQRKLDSQDTKINDFKAEVNTSLSNQTTSINQTTSVQNSKITTLESRMDTFTSLKEGSTTGDAELTDIRVGANDTTYNTAGDAVRGQYTQLNDGLSTVIYPYVNLSDKDIRVIKKLYIPIGTKFRVETFNGQNFGQTTTLRLLDVNKNEISYYSIFENTSYRDMINDLDKDIHYIKLNGGQGINPFKAISFIPSTLSGRVDKLESNVFNEMDSILLSKDYLRNGSISNANNTDIVASKLIFTKAKSIKVVTDRPNKSGFKYVYSYASSSGICFDLNNNLPFRKNFIDYSEPLNYSDEYESWSGGDIYGVQIAIGEYNPTTEIFNPLRVSDFEGYKIYVYDTTGVKNSLRLDLIENGKGYPSFYDSYILDRIENIKYKDILIGNSGDSFTFITDLHDQNNYYSPFLAKKIYDNTSVKKIVYGGDYINEPSSKETALSLLSDRRNKCMVKDDVIVLRGNHDTNPYGTGQLTVGEFYSIFDKHIEKHINTNKNTYFYYDNESQKIRYIFVDSGVDGTISDTQKNWIKVNTENLSAEWTIVVFMHHGIYTDVKDDRTNIKAYSSLTTVKQVLANVTAKIACIICGHIHIDLSDTSGAYPIICTTCDAHGVQASSMSSDNRDVGTINEQAFDVFHIDTANKKVYATRIGGGENNVIESGNYSLNDREFSYS